MNPSPVEQFARDTFVKFVGGTIHKYYVDGIAMNTSVTSVVHQFFSHFDKSKTALNMIRGKNFWTDDVKYEKYWPLVKKKDEITAMYNSEDFWEDEDQYGHYWDGVKELSTRNAIKELITICEKEAVADIIDMWDRDGAEAAALGTAMHANIEEYYNNGTPLPNTKECHMFSQFDIHARSLGYRPFRQEQVVYDVSASLAGSIDELYINDSGNIWIVDWKRAKDIKMEGFGNKKGTGPMSDKNDCNYEHYSLQLNIYKYMLETHYGLKIARMSLVILHPNQDDYILLDASDNQKAVQLIMAARVKKFAGMTSHN